MKSRQLTILFLCILLGVSSVAHAQRLKSMDFRNQSITDILMALAEASGTSIIPDQTVTGTASFYFSESDFEEALGLFLSTYRLTYTREGNVYRVSRISISVDAQSKLVSLKADDVDVESLVRALSKALGTTILYDPLPKTNISVAIDKLTAVKSLEILTRRLSEYNLETGESFFYIRRVPVEQQGRKGGANTGIVKTGERYSLSVDKARFLELLADLFKKGGREYSLMLKTDTVLENLYFSDRDFEGLLRLILEQGNADFIIRDGVYYILELQRRDVVKKLKKTSLTTLNYLNAQELPNLLPSELASGNIMKIDKNTNTVMLTGSDEEIKPILDFIALIDRPLDGLVYERFDIRYLKVKDLLAIIPPKMTPIAPLVIPESNAFIVLGTTEGLATLRHYVGTVDSKAEGFPIRLKYLKTEEFLKALPPSITKEDIVDSGFPNLFFFTGSEDKRKLFMRELSSIDKPRPQIRYELLVIQYLENDKEEYKVKLGSQPDSNEPSMSYLGKFDEILSLNFDVISQFGVQFSSALSFSISQNLAQVFADTTLNGLSGQEIKFQNTDTSRTPSIEFNETTKAYEKTGVPQEITSGLIVSLNGWVSGDNMITMTVNATVSKQNNDTTSESALPSTSERVVTTQVRTPSGKPIVISGLVKEDVTQSIQKFPILGDIPLLGLLFRNKGEIREKSEIVIYIVPHLSYEGDEETTDIRLERYYRNFVKGTR